MSTNDDAGRPLLTRADVARLMSVERQTVARLEARGELPAVRFGRMVRYDPDDVDRLIARTKNEAGADNADLVTNAQAARDRVRA